MPLQDHETLNTHGINDDKTVHLVIKTGQGSNRATAESSSAPSQPRTNPSQVTSSTECLVLTNSETNC